MIRGDIAHLLRTPPGAAHARSPSRCDARAAELSPTAGLDQHNDFVGGEGAVIEPDLVHAPR